MPVHNQDVRISFRNAVGTPVSDTNEIAIYSPPADAGSVPSIYVGASAILSAAHYVPVTSVIEGSRTSIYNYGTSLTLQSSDNADSSYIQAYPSRVNVSASGTTERSALQVHYGAIDLTSEYKFPDRDRVWCVAVNGQSGVSVYKEFTASSYTGGDKLGCAFSSISHSDGPTTTMVAGHNMYLGAWRETEEFGYLHAGESELEPTQSIELKSEAADANGVYVISQSPDSLPQANLIYGSWYVSDTSVSPRLNTFSFNVGKISGRAASSFVPMLRVGYEYSGEYNLIHLTADTIQIGQRPLQPSPFTNQTLIYGVVTPTSDNMAANKGYVDDEVAKKATVLKGTLSIPVGVWSAASSPYAATTIDISIPNSGIQAGDDVFIAPDLQFASSDTWIYEYSKIAGVKAAENALRFMAYETPSVDIRIKWMIIR